MRLIKNTSKRVLALIISVLMIISMLPVSVLTVFALSNPTLTTDITEKAFYTEQATEFTFTTTAGTQENAMVLGSFTLLDEGGADAQSAVKTLEYWDVTGNCYREFYGDFGPAATGFPLTDATSKFRVTFKDAGKYTVKAAMINFADRSVLVSAEDATIIVKPYKSELTTDIDTKTFVNNTEVEFTYTTIANAQANTMVLGTFSVLDSESNDAQNCIKKLEYWDVTGNCYREFYGDFGPAATGFPLTDATSKFRVTFGKAGTYTVNAAMKKFDGGEILCSNTKTITVQTNNSVLTTDITEKAFEVNEEVEFTYTTKANDFTNTMVLGKFVLKKNGNEIDKNSIKLEYWDVTGNCYREFYGNFGPAATGFPLTDATSKFRVMFKETGEYNVLVQMVTFDGNVVISENAATIEVKDTIAPVISEIKGNATDWTNNDVVLEVVATDNSGKVTEYRMDDGEWQTSNSFTVTENGKHKFYAKDAAGKISVVSDEIEVKYIDKVAPAIGTISLDPNDWTKDAVTVTVPATDIGINEILYKMDNGEWQTSNEFTIKDNAIHKFYVKDSLGNENTVPAEIKADKYDDKAPVINSLTPNTTEWVSDEIVITVDATDAGVQGIAYKIGANGTWQSENTFTVITNGKYQVYVKDALGNEIATPAEIEINNIDKTNPEIVDFTSTTEKWTNSDVVISGTVKDTQSGVIKLQYKINDGSWNDLTFDAEGEFSLTIPDECNVVYTFRCEDAVGNGSTGSYVKSVKIDKTEADVSANPISDTWKNSQISISGTLSDSASGIKSAVYDNNKGDTGNLSIVGNDFTFNTNVAASGEYTYVITVTDNAGNKKVINSNVVKIDLDNPVTSVQPATAWTNQEVAVVVTATDANAGISKVYYKKNGGTPVEIHVIDGAYKFIIPNASNDNAQYEIYSVDNSGRQSSSVYYTSMIDVTKPQKPTISYSKALGYRIIESLTFGLYKAPVTVTIVSSDDLSELKEIRYYLDYVDGDAGVPLTPNDEGEVSFTISPDKQHKISAVAFDFAGNDSTREIAGSDGTNSFGGVVVDGTKPVVESVSADITNWTNGNVVISGTVSDNLSGVEKVYYIKGDSTTPIEITTFDKENNTFEFTVAAQSYKGKYYVYCVDYSTNESEKKSVDVMMDNTIPNVDSQSASITTWTNNNITVSGKVSDDLSGVAKVYWRQGADTTENTATLNADGTYEFTITARDYEGLIYIGCYDVTGNKSDEQNVAVQMDATKPSVDSVNASTSDWTNGKVVVTGAVSDKIVNDAISKVVAVKYSYDNITNGTATFDSVNGTFTFDVPARNYDGEITVWCVDDAGNESVSEKVRVRMDTTKPQVDTGKAEPDVWTKENVVVSGIVSDAEVNGAVSNVKTVMYKYNNGEDKVATFDGSKYTIEIPKQDYKGDVSVWCIDNAGNISVIKNTAVKMDVTAPANVEIKYTESLPSKFINMITFGFYSIDKPLTVTISATDNLALDEIKYTVSGVKGKYDLTDASFGDTVKVTPTALNQAGDIVAGYITFNVPAEFKGKIEATAYDCAGNNTEQKTNDKDYDEVIVDSIAPNIDITYEAVDNTNTKVHFVDAQNANADSFDKANQAIYNGNVNATITITENNFFEGVKKDENGIVHEVGILVTKTDNDGVVTKIEYLPKGAAKLYNDADETVEFEWDTTGNIHKYTIPYDKDADYVITVEYVDFSGNKADISANDGNTGEAAYTSKIVTVDKIAPVITIKYENEDIKATYGARQYFTENQFALITVEEHNFRADDFKAVVTAKYSDGETDVEVADFATILCDDAKWTKTGNVYTIKLEYVVDANYTFDYTYEDLAQNPAKEYVTDEFTVDKQDPHTPTVKYEGDVKTTILDKVLNVITFGYYDAKVKVTITAADDVSGIDHFVYSYIKADKVSDVNASLENVTIESKNITQNGKTFTATFEIPKDVLEGTNQFNGTVKFTAFDRSTRNSEHKETATIVVDNIAPTATITYNEPIQKANDISYYAGNIEAKIVINEANFYKEDVIVKVNGNVVDVTWVNDSADIHTGTFTLTADGDYVVTVEYTDRSKNEMEIYTSNRLTIDTKAPTVTVSNVVNNSANPDEKYGFTITAKDINIDSTAFKPTLTAVVLNENGTFTTKNISFGDLNTVKAGEEYSFTIDNLADDAIYTLICTVEDMSDNKYEKVVLSDGKEYESVRFSINRNGSTYGIEENTADLIEKYYVQNVTDNVVIFETNADVLSEYKVTVNGKELAKDTDYTVTEEGGNGSWMKYTYSVNKELFANEGEYKIVVSSKDKAENDAFSDVKDATVNFVVDRTAPIVTITGLANDGRYQTDVQTVTLIPTDDGGALKSLIVRTVDEDGNQLKEILNLAGEELEKAIADGAGKITFKIEKGLYQNVQIICDDCAVDEDGKTNVYDVTIKNISVDANAFIVNFWANKPLRWGSIAGVILLAAAIILFVFFKKRKKEN